MRRRTLSTAATATVLQLLAPAARAQADAPGRIGVLMLHGKNPGNNRDPYFRPSIRTFEREGWVAAFPEMPWASTRYIDGNWDLAMAEIASHVKALRDKGATRIAIVGHSIGAPAAMSYAARGGDVQALVLLAPGHTPLGFYTRSKVVRESVDEARALVAAGNAKQSGRFNDLNQGRPLSVSMAAGDYLSYLDPASDAEMSVTAPRIPAATPVFTVIGNADPLFSIIRGYYVEKLPPNPRSRYLEVQGTHLTTPEVAGPEMVAWIRSALAPEAEPVR